MITDFKQFDYVVLCVIFFIFFFLIFVFRLIELLETIGFNLHQIWKNSGHCLHIYMFQLLLLHALNTYYQAPQIPAVNLILCSFHPRHHIFIFGGSIWVLFFSFFFI